jgi:1-hydroxycarotenoid 3,4-desaturase
MTSRAVVIGGGFGGLCAAYTLQASGVDTTVLERQPHVGGKARNHDVAGRPVPGGPTVLTMREIFDRLFAVAGERLDDHLVLTPLERLAHHRWSADEQLDLYRDVDRSAEAIAAFAGPAEADGYRRFVADAARIYQTVEEPFIRSAKPDLFALARATGPFGAYKIKPFDTLWSALGRHFRDPRLKQLFGRYATYCGSSPFSAPATLMLIAHVEQRGVWAVDGGLHALARAIADGVERCGGTILTGTPAREIVVDGGAAKGVATDEGVIEADLVIYNGDVAAIGAGHLGKPVSRVASPVAPENRTLSAVTFSGLARLRGSDAYHTVCFGQDYRAEFEALFGRRTMPDDPTVYVCAPDNPTDEETPQRVLVVMNAPADGDRHEFDEEDIERCRHQAMATLERCGMSLAFAGDRPTTPQEFAQMLPATGGALYGRTSHGWTASFQRAPIRTRLRGLYLAGGSVHPGPGVPMSSLSGRIAAACALMDSGSVSRSRRAATSGGTSTG